MIIFIRNHLFSSSLCRTPSSLPLRGCVVVFDGSVPNRLPYVLAVVVDRQTIVADESAPVNLPLIPIRADFTDSAQSHPHIITIIMMYIMHVVFNVPPSVIFMSLQAATAVAALMMMYGLCDIQRRDCQRHIIITL